ncbi:hypothetical protein HH212_01065 [Massilia forsythiae]|uniref:DUF3761 domain-containing protein n=1 Tax=Massilia forsythiae TaxID=2728020 RepID=A0A7Z2VT98_9BURK|nr:hypothetical protein [Massilia forsythiae]QJD98798.1 hypothetical protein HH212_01065 [Massilia forsythiae]
MEPIRSPSSRRQAKTAQSPLQALALAMLFAWTALPAQAVQAREVQAAQQQAAQPQATQPQAAQPAQQARQAQAIQKARQAQAVRPSTPAGTGEGNASTRRQTERTDRANRAATIADEAGDTGQPAAAAAAAGQHAGAAGAAGAAAPGAARSADTSPGTAAAGPSYGPVLDPQAADAARKDPAEVHDETDSQARQAQPQGQPSAQAGPAGQSQRGARAGARRHPAWQAPGALAPRPLQPAGNELAAGIPVGSVPVPPPATAPRPAVPSSTAINACVGGVCTDAGGAVYNGIGSGNAGVSSSGRACARTGATVQCF